MWIGPTTVWYIIIHTTHGNLLQLAAICWRRLSILNDLSFRSLTSLGSGKYVFLLINVLEDEPLPRD